MGRRPLPPGQDKRSRRLAGQRASQSRPGGQKDTRALITLRQAEDNAASTTWQGGLEVARKVSFASVSGVTSVASTPPLHFDVSDRTLRFGQHKHKHKLLSTGDTRALLLHHGWVKPQTEATELPHAKKQRAGVGRVSVSSAKWKGRIKTLDRAVIGHWTLLEAHVFVITTLTKLAETRKLAETPLTLKDSDTRVKDTHGHPWRCGCKM